MRLFIIDKLGPKAITARKKQMKVPNRATRCVAASAALLAFLVGTPAPRLLAQAKPAPSAPAKATTTLTVLITGARSARGKMVVWLFKDAPGYPSDTSKIFRQQSVDVDPTTKTAQVIFKDLP